MAKVVLGENKEVSLNSLRVPFQLCSQLTDTNRSLGHNAPKHLDTAIGAQYSEIDWVLEVDTMQRRMESIPWKAEITKSWRTSTGPG